LQEEQHISCALAAKQLKQRESMYSLRSNQQNGIFEDINCPSVNEAFATQNRPLFSEKLT
jgi:hypothetical protein